MIRITCTQNFFNDLGEEQPEPPAGWEFIECHCGAKTPIKYDKDHCVFCGCSFRKLN